MRLRADNKAVTLGKTMKPEVIRRIVQQATSKGAPFRLSLTNGQSIKVPREEMLWITEDLIGVAHSSNPGTGLPRNPAFLDPKEIAEVEILKRRAAA